MFPRETHDEERSESQYQCLIQVKSTDVGAQHSQIKLSNMKRLAESPLPAFILFLSFGGSRACDSAHLVHVGKELIARTLGRVRKLVVRNVAESISTRTLRVRWATADRLMPRTGASLLERIRAVIGPSLAEYSKDKMRILNTVGYGAGNSIGKVNVIVPDEYRQRHPDELLVDAKLGLIGELETRGGEVRTLRFGIPGKRVVELGDGARMSFGLGSPTAEGELVVRSQDREKVARVNAAVRGASSETSLKEGGIAKVRIDLPMSHFTMSLPSMVGTLVFPFPAEDERMNLQEARKIAGVISVLEHAARVGEPVWMGFDGNHIGTLSPPDPEGVRQFGDWARLVDNGYLALQALDIEPSVCVTLRELIVQKDALQVVRASRFGRIPSGTVFIFSLRKGVAPEVGEKMCFPTSFDIRLGEVAVTTFLSLIGDVSGDRSPQGEYLVPVNRIEVDRIVQVGESLALPRPRTEYLQETALDRAEEMGVLCWWEESSTEDASNPRK